jgi:hypothetical protein
LVLQRKDASHNPVWTSDLLRRKMISVVSGDASEYRPERLKRLERLERLEHLELPSVHLEL